MEVGGGERWDGVKSRESIDCVLIRTLLLSYTFVVLNDVPLLNERLVLHDRNDGIIVDSAVSAHLHRRRAARATLTFCGHVVDVALRIIPLDPYVPVLAPLR